MATKRFLPYNFQLNSYSDLETYLIQLDERIIEDAADLDNFLLDYSEVQAYCSENMAWRYIKMTIDTTDEERQKSYSDFVQTIQPKLSEFYNKYNKKIHASPYKNRLLKNDGYDIMFRDIASAIELFREENIPLQSQMAELSKKYGATVGAMQVELDGEKLTLQQAGKKLQSDDRETRKTVYEAIQKVRFVERENLHKLLDELIELRQQVAKNAGFDNYIDYRFKSLGRFDYGVKECEDFHQAVKEQILPIVEQFTARKKEKLGVDTLRPYDLSGRPKDENALEPFTDEQDLIAKSKKVFDKIDPDFGSTIDALIEHKHLDLESKKGKAPGGYNYPLYESGIPFIFMNAVGTHSDMITMMHEGGHAVHSVLTKDLTMTHFKGFPSEIAELASMSTELISMDYWDEFYPNPEDLNRAKMEQLERVLDVLPWVALVDKFQLWLYRNPGHTHAEREATWVEFHNEFSPSNIDYTGYEDYSKVTWQKQLHIYEVPFYYIEYGIAQLGAIGVWKNYTRDKTKALYHFKKALAGGNTFTLPQTYDKAKVPFDFSSANIKKLSKFVEKEMAKLTAAEKV